ncbi:hypothetical protein SHKM778_95900 (plasmid) [Streptomyces sp. KM77-8]|uniref:Helicase-associated domain-containing protein n=1 Tax=Streptomyces haneummycinicus TaxID=3074435 RepID=A0AAT9I0R5_9ACTN
MEQAEQLRQLDAWWNPPWPVDWQRAWYRARADVHKQGPVHGGDNLAGLPRWLQRWLRHQFTHYEQLHKDQQVLLAELGLTAVEVERFHAWPGRRRPTAEGLAVARALPPVTVTSPCPGLSSLTASLWASGSAISVNASAASAGPPGWATI